MKNESPFSKLPSLSELLGHPTVAQVVKRVNQTTIAQRAAGFLDELQTSLRHRIDQGNIPSLGQLAERLARRLLGPAQTSLAAVNATGVLLGQRWPALPLAEPAVDEMVRLATEYQADPQTLLQRVIGQLTELAGAEAALLVNNYGAACEMVRWMNAGHDDARFAGLINPQEHGLSSYSTIGERLAAGNELVVIDAAGLIGGPPCGIILGKRERVDDASRNPFYSLATPNTLTLAALTSTLSLYQTNDSVKHQIPIWQLLTTPVENLEQRAHRLAMLINEGEQISSALPQCADTMWCDLGGQQLSGPSWAINVFPREGAFDTVVSSLQEACPQILSLIGSDQITLDLRGIFPRWDQHLVAAFE